jgi:hypothetical protein
MEKLAEWKIIADIRIMGGMADDNATTARQKKAARSMRHGFVLSVKDSGVRIGRTPEILIRASRYGRKVPCCCSTSRTSAELIYAVATHIRAEVRAVDMLAP